MKIFTMAFLLTLSVFFGSLFSQSFPAGGEASLDVAKVIEISQKSITARDYCSFLNEMATTDDVHHLYELSMGRDAAFAYDVAPIARLGSLGNYRYAVLEGREDWPVASLSRLDALRFCNWLENGKPKYIEAGLEMATTESGTYTLENNQVVFINPKATYYLREKKWGDS